MFTTCTPPKILGTATHIFPCHLRFIGSPVSLMLSLFTSRPPAPSCPKESVGVSWLALLRLAHEAWL